MFDPTVKKTVGAKGAREKAPQRPQQSLVVSPVVALFMLLTPVLVRVKSPHLSVAMAVPVLRVAVSRKVWSAMVGVMRVESHCPRSDR